MKTYIYAKGGPLLSLGALAVGTIKSKYYRIDSICAR